MLTISANEIQQAGQAEANKIGMVSSAIYEANLTDATIVGLSQMFRQLKILREDHNSPWWWYEPWRMWLSKEICTVWIR